MNEMDDVLLRQAEQYLMEGSGGMARAVLANHLRQYPNSMQGWWLLSFAVDEPRQQIECLERVLRIDPNHVSARSRLEIIKGGGISQPFVPPFVDSTEFEQAYQESAASLPEEAPVSEPRPSSPRKPAPRRKAGAQVLQYSVLAVMGCIAVTILGFVVVFAVQGYAAPAQPQPSNPESFTPILLPPTWTPTPSATLLPSLTPAQTATPPPAEPTAAEPSSTPVPVSQTGPYKGYNAPDFTLTNINDDKKVKLSDYRGKAVVIFFWTTWCPYCESEMPAIELIYKTYKDRGLEILAVDVGESAFLGRSYRDSHGLTFPILDDPRSSVASKYNVAGYPTHYFVDQNGVISSIWIGELDYWGFNNKVQELLNISQ